MLVSFEEKDGVRVIINEECVFDVAAPPPSSRAYSLPGWIVLLAPGYALVGLSARLHQGRVRLRREQL